MASIKLAIDENGPKRVEVRWSGQWKDIRVLFDGEEIGRMVGNASLDQGLDFEFPHGLGILRVQLHRGFAGSELRVSRNGAPLPGSSSDPASRIKTASQILYFIAGLNAVFGLIGQLGDVAFLRNIGFGWATVGFGLVYAVLGYLVAKNRSTVALVIATALFGIDGVFSIAVSFGALHSPPIGAVIMRVFLILPLIRAIAPTREVKRR